jgi:hypothetical protein
VNAQRFILLVKGEDDFSSEANLGTLRLSRIRGAFETLSKEEREAVASRLSSWISGDDRQRWLGLFLASQLHILEMLPRLRQLQDSLEAELEAGHGRPSIRDDWAWVNRIIGQLSSESQLR